MTRAGIHARYNCVCTHTAGIMESLGLPDKVQKYEQFLNERLKSDLKIVLGQRDQVYTDIAEWTQLKQTISHLQEVEGPLKTMVDVGCNVYVQAKVGDARRVFVAVGMGFFVEMELQEASVFVDKKINILTKRSEELTQQSCEINARIKMVLEALNELQFSSCTGAAVEHSHRHVW